MAHNQGSDKINKKVRSALRKREKFAQLKKEQEGQQGGPNLSPEQQQVMFNAFMQMLMQGSIGMPGGMGAPQGMMVPFGGGQPQGMMQPQLPGWGGGAPQQGGGGFGGPMDNVVAQLAAFLNGQQQMQGQMPMNSGQQAYMNRAQAMPMGYTGAPLQAGTGGMEPGPEEVEGSGSKKPKKKKES